MADMHGSSVSRPDQASLDTRLACGQEETDTVSPDPGYRERFDCTVADERTAEATGMTSHANRNGDEEEDLDLFLTGVESKLRGPFSSLDLARAISTAALRGSKTPRQYLALISKVFARPDKVVQLRILVGLLGLDHTPETDDAVLALLRQAQESHDEDWVPTLAGIVQGLMMLGDPATDDDDDDDDATDPSSATTAVADPKPYQGQDARKLLHRTAKDILQQVGRHLSATAKDLRPDMNPHFAPNHYSLLEPQQLKPIIPFDTNPHFHVDTSADLLRIDERLEEERAKEELHHSNATVAQRNATRPGSARPGSMASVVGASSARRPQPDLPGFRTSSKMRGRATGTKGPSMFMAAKKPIPARGPASAGKRTAGMLARRPGGAQSVLARNRLKQRLGASKLAGGAASRTANQRSKMKMIDVSEVNELNKEHQQRDDMDSKRKSRKQRILQSAQQRGLVQLSGASKTASQQQQSGQSAATATTPTQPSGNTDPSAQVASAASPQSDGQKEWELLLANRSNRITPEQRERIRQFFEDQHNPNPEQQVYEIKMHDQKTTDPSTGQAIKETFYLELDYRTFTSKLSKKTKRY